MASRECRKPEFKVDREAIVERLKKAAEIFIAHANELADHYDYCSCDYGCLDTAFGMTEDIETIQGFIDEWTKNKK